MGGYCGHQFAIGAMHTGAKSWGGLVTLFSDGRLLLPSVSYRGHTYRCQIWGWLGDAFFLMPSVRFKGQHQYPIVNPIQSSYQSFWDCQAWAYIWHTMDLYFGDSTRAYIEYILGVTWAYLRFVIVMSWVHRYIFCMSSVYLGHMLSIYWANFELILGISLAYGYILGFFWAYNVHILGISWVYLGHIMNINWAYLGHILGISWRNMGIFKYILVITWHISAYFGHILCIWKEYSRPMLSIS